jgi:ornithine cyclodeaminase/alanine dehydrogenase-like protein (mu-crystallin family)
VRPTFELAEAVRGSDVCVTCTPSRQAFLLREHVGPGTFVAGVGADSRGKHELDPRLLAAASVVVDVLDQCATDGDLQHALAAGLMTRESVYAELGDVLTGRKPGRRSAEEITVFDSTGTALEDVAAAVLVYERALATGAGLRIALGE